MSSCCGGNNSNGCCKSKLQQAPSAAVPLLRGNKSSNADSSSSSSNGASYGAVWSIDNAAHAHSDRTQQLQEVLGDVQPLGSKCGAHESGGQCCKELKGDDERHLISPEIVRDVIIGLSDGLTVPFALTAGLSSLGSSSLVVTGGLAELCAGAISMGLVASQAELDHFHYLRRQTQARVLRSCAGEMEREIHSILGPLGVKEPLSRLVAEDLRSVEDEIYGPPGAQGSEGVMQGTDVVSESGNMKWGLLNWRTKKTEEEDGGMCGNQEMGMTAFLLKFGEGMEEVPVSRLYVSALTIGLSYFIGGLIPLIPYMATSTAEVGLLYSAIVTSIILFIFGGFKTYFTGATGGWYGYAYGAVSTMIVGGFAAGAAFGLVKALDVQD
ncbi:membrane fraction protein [Cryptococcus deuterogattii 99/473]|uniref:Unplaced genomic scaffold supercont1.13, whole genome shotgun sequence n=1 Tax=Cryptococcus deuterogattii Ram5 TaxID=1296110 RepID=A0A0D0T001_9TREE|nr:membrane fraction protein [Cryptococcus deuterogattii LA55]KIR38887.1 membrane fraction protein [Cryptococcus deuterogattii Ram5]KIR75914.1 membrane fraction protein [Cryptococcus deuterogattii CA1014]KIR95856.1 membrane fraction protein [Cryptococcus deuterogattii CBS 10090]KIS02352.1 membrane fraction protein [Cryptococcus deuterogattii 2001/935-1]KIY58799.1 membrane fraction protein [Cryptococcus deuterogattii 99/473]